MIYLLDLCFYSVVNLLRDYRRTDKSFAEYCIVRDIREKEIRFWTDPGRALRPLLIVNQVDRSLSLKHSDVQKMRSDVCIHIFIMFFSMFISVNGAVAFPSCCAHFPFFLHCFILASSVLFA